MKSSVIFDSRISKKVDRNLMISFKLEENELDFLMKLFQAYKHKNITVQLSIENFTKELIFSNVEYFKEISDYDKLYSKENEK